MKDCRLDSIAKTGFLDIVPVIMAGIIGIYGLVVSVLVSDGLKQDLPLYTGFIQLGAGLSVGLAGLAAGYNSISKSQGSFTTDLGFRFAIGIVGDAGVRGTAQQPRLFVGMILILIFAEVLGKLSSDITKEQIRILNFTNRPLWSHRSFTHELKGYARCYMLDSSPYARPSYRAPSPIVCRHSRTILFSKMYEQGRETGRTSAIEDEV